MCLSERQLEIYLLIACHAQSAEEFVPLAEQSNQRVSIRVARPEVRRACESLEIYATISTPIAIALSTQSRAIVLNRSAGGKI